MNLLRFDVVVNAPMEPRIFPVSTIVDGVPCIRVSTMDTGRLPSETIKVYCRDGSGDATSQHDTPDGLVQEVHVGGTSLGYALSGQKISPRH